MTRLAIALALATSALLAGGWPSLASTDQYPLQMADRFAQRTDVDEVLLPPDPQGPANPTPFCAPSAPFCP